MEMTNLQIIGIAMIGIPVIILLILLGIECNWYDPFLVILIVIYIIIAAELTVGK